MNYYLLFLFTLLTSIISAQNSKFDGEWKLTDSKVESDVLVKENGIWRDLYKNNSSINITGENFIFSLDEKQIDATYEIKNQEFYLYFPKNAKEKQSYTVYNYKLQGNLLTLYREDPSVKESYTFSKN